MDLPRISWVKLHRLRTGVGRLYSSIYKWGLAPSPKYECSATDQTAYHVISTCPLHRAPRGVAGLTVLDDDTRCWLIPPQPASDLIRFFGCPSHEEEDCVCSRGAVKNNKFLRGTHVMWWSNRVRGCFCYAAYHLQSLVKRLKTKSG